MFYLFERRKKLAVFYLFEREEEVGGVLPL